MVAASFQFIGREFSVCSLIGCSTCLQEDLYIWFHQWSSFWRLYACMHGYLAHTILCLLLGHYCACGRLHAH